MRIALAQYNPIVGDIGGNVARMAALIDQARDRQVDLVVFSELSVEGYPPRDLLGKERFVADSVEGVERLADHCRGIAALVGHVRRTPGDAGRPLQNVAALLIDGEVGHVHVKSLLPTYDVFDETRYFQPGNESGCLNVGGRSIGLSICEDLWDSQALGRELDGEDPLDHLVGRGAEIIINMAASPYQMGKAKLREELFCRQARRAKAPIIYVNQVGGNDELVFDGSSCVVMPDGQVVARARSFAEDLLVVDLDQPEARLEPIETEIARLSKAIKLGLRDYLTKCGFGSVVLGLSGGIDSAVVAVLAADAIGPENVVTLAMPSRYSSEHSLADAEKLASNCGLPYHVVPIESMHAAFESELQKVIDTAQADVAAENVQARIRGTIVMAVSNAQGHLAVATGNKSELSVGYCTLYGDMAGGLAPIGDVLKTQVYRLAEQLNAEAGYDRIPRSVLTKAPSAELKPDQTDQDKLPPYELLDAILYRYIEEDRTASEIAAEGYDPEVVHRVVKMVDAAEYKRQQAAPVLKVTARAFGTGRRMPIAQRYRQRSK